MKIAVLCGGRSSERDVSLSTGIQVARALRETGHDVVLVDACVDFPLDCRPEEVFEKALPIENHAIGAAAPCVERFFDRASGFFGKNVLEICKSADIVFNALHGDEGENGKLQAVFDLLNICNEQEPFKAAFPHARNSDPRSGDSFRIGQMPRSRALRKARFALRCEARKPRLKCRRFNRPHER